jgi:hypothetical protein
MNTRTTDLAFSQSASPEEKAAILQNEKRLNTRVAMSSLLDPPAGGRFAKPSPPVDPAKLYAPLPPSSPWGSGPQVGLEPPLGFSVNDLEPTGELHELQRSAQLTISLMTVARTPRFLLPRLWPTLLLHCFGRPRRASPRQHLRLSSQMLPQRRPAALYRGDGSDDLRPTHHNP